jgi:hypothetical protein
MCVVQADASLLSSIIMVQDLLIESQRPRSHPVHVVGVVRCPQTVKVANYMVKDLSQGTMTAELLQPDELVSGLMAQVHPHLYLFEYLLGCLVTCSCTALLTHLLAYILGHLQLHSIAYSLACLLTWLLAAAQHCLLARLLACLPYHYKLTMSRDLRNRTDSICICFTLCA